MANLGESRAARIGALGLALVVAGCDPGKMQADTGTTGEANESESGEDDDESGLPSFDSTSGDDGDGDSGAASAGSGAEDPDSDLSDNCGEVNVQGDALPPNLMLVLDKSFTMADPNNAWNDGGTMRTRWESLHIIVSKLLEDFGSQVNFGVKIFPVMDATNTGANKCDVDRGVDVEVGLDTKNDILAAIPEATAKFEGHTPTRSALERAVEYMKSLEDGNAEAIILIVDGDTTCGQSNAQVAEVAADSFANDIPVFVVGVALEDKLVDGMQDIAKAGGTERLFNTTDADALQTELVKLVSTLESCTIKLETPPMFEEFVKVSVDGNSVPWLREYTDCADAAAGGSADGWVFTSDKEPFDEIEICGQHCDEFLQVQKADIVFGCLPPGQ